MFPERTDSASHAASASDDSRPRRRAAARTATARAQRLSQHHHRRQARGCGRTGRDPGGPHRLVSLLTRRAVNKCRPRRAKGRVQWRMAAVFGPAGLAQDADGEVAQGPCSGGRCLAEGRRRRSRPDGLVRGQAGDAVDSLGAPAAVSVPDLRVIREACSVCGKSRPAFTVTVLTPWCPPRPWPQPRRPHRKRRCPLHSTAGARWPCAGPRTGPAGRSSTPQRSHDLLRSIRGSLTDRRDRTGPGQDRARRDRQHHRQHKTGAAATCPRLTHRAERGVGPGTERSTAGPPMAPHIAPSRRCISLADRASFLCRSRRP